METTTCSFCGGDGYIDGNICETCYGAGSLPPLGMSSYLMKHLLAVAGVAQDLDERIADLEDKVDDILDKCNDIFEKVSE